MSPYRNCFGKGLNSLWRPLANSISAQPDRVPTTGREPRQYKMPVLLILCKRAQKGADAAPGPSKLLSYEEIQPVTGAPTPLPFLLPPLLSLYVAVRSHLLPRSHWCHNAHLASGGASKSGCKAAGWLQHQTFPCKVDL